MILSLYFKIFEPTNYTRAFEKCIVIYQIGNVEIENLVTRLFRNCLERWKIVTGRNYDLGNCEVFLQKI